MTHAIDQVGIGIIGSGWGARVQVPAFRAAGLNVVALAGSQARKTQRLAAELDIPYATGDWRTLLERSDVHLISIATPPTLHAAIACDALAAGKHVLCEKPTAINADEADIMRATAQQYPAQFALIDHELRFLPAIQKARQLVVEGAIGNLRHAEARFINSSRANLQRTWNWWSDREQGGGILGAICSHQVDTLRYILNDEAIAVQGSLYTFVDQRPYEPQSGGNKSMRMVTSDDFAAFHMRLARGGIASITASMVARINEPQHITIYGDEGTLRFVEGHLFYAAPEEVLHDVTPPHTIQVAEHIKDLYPDFAEATVYMGYALRAALAGDRSALAHAATFEDGLCVQEVLDAVHESVGDDGVWKEP